LTAVTEQRFLSGRLSSPRAAGAVAGLICLTAGACGNVNAALEHLSQARQLSADLYVHFMAADDAANRAVLADTDQTSVAYAHESEQAIQAVESDVRTLRPLLQALGYSDEGHQLDAFDIQFVKYRSVNQTILDLAVENTNLKAQRLSFDAAQEAADAFSTAAGVVEARDRADTWHLKALAATAISSVRELQALEAPHIAEADNAVMAQLEQRMSHAETTTRSALREINGLAAPASQSHLVNASAAFDRFMTIHRDILSLSHRNTNVRSLALSLNEKPPLRQNCEEGLRALRAALAKRGVPTGRW
jgi:hypothetical protein